MASSLHLAEHNLVAGLAYCPRLVDELGVMPEAFTDEAARDVLLLVQAVYSEHGDDRPIGIWELEAASNSIPERPLDRHDKSDLANVLLGGEMLFRQAASNWHVVSQEWRRRRFVHGLADVARPDVSIDTAIPDLRQLCEELEGESPVDRLTVLSSADLDTAEFFEEELIRDVLMARQPCILGGPKKCCKTLVAIDLTLSLASGSSFLGQFPTARECRVALFSGESGGATIQESARRIARSKSWWNLADYTNAFWSFDLPTFDKPNSVAALKRFLRDNGIEVAVLDPTYLMLPAAADDYKSYIAMGKHLRPLSELAAELNVTPIICNHFVKSVSVTESPPGLEDLSGAGFAEWARQWILLSRRSPYDLENVGHHELWLGTGGSAGHGAGMAVDIDEGSRRDNGGRRWDVVVTSIGKAVASAIDEREERAAERKREKEERELAAAVDAVVKALERNPAGLTLSKLRDGFSITRAYLTKAVDRLEEEGRVERCDDIPGGNKRTYDGVRLLESQSAATGSNRQEVGLPSVPDASAHNGQLPL